MKLAMTGRLTHSQRPQAPMEERTTGDGHGPCDFNCCGNGYSATATPPSEGTDADGDSWMERAHLPVTLRDFAAASTAAGTAVPAVNLSMDSVAPPDLSHVAAGSAGLDM